MQEQCEPVKQWLLTPYKLSYAELETIVNDWPKAWREPVILEEVLIGPPVDAPVDPVPETK